MLWPSSKLNAGMDEGRLEPGYIDIGPIDEASQFGLLHVGVLK